MRSASVITGPEEKLGGGGGGPVVHSPPGGGGGGDEDSYPNFGEQLRRYRLDMAIGLISVGMLFVAFTSAYMVRKGLGQFNPATNSYISDWVPLKLPVNLLLFDTGLILLSSFTIEKARRAALEKAVIAPVTRIPGISADSGRRMPWLSISVLLGIGFLLGQLWAWRIMAHRGFFLASTPSSSFFYVLTGLHGLHLAGGIIALLYALLATSFGARSLERRRIVVDVTAWYWHSIALIWVYAFVLLELTV